MKTSGTKPMKNTMRKPSPLKFFTPNAAMGVTKKVSDAVSAVKVKKAKGTAKGATTSGTFTTKKETATSGKTRGAFGGALEKAKALASKVKASAGKPETAKVEGKPSSRPGSTTPKGAFGGALSKAKAIASKAKAQDNKPVEGKPSAKPTASKAKAEMATKTAATVKKSVSNTALTPAMQLKKAGMKKKC